MRTKTELDLQSVLAEYGPDEFPESRFDTPLTGVLKRYADAFSDQQRTRKVATQRGQHMLATRYKQEEQILADFLADALQQHPTWAFLEPLTGLKGALAARVIGEIGHPYRFPGQKCADGHYATPTFAPGTQCPALIWPKDNDGKRAQKRVQCSAVMGPPRVKKDETGVKSLWHFAGLHVVSACCGVMRSYEGVCERCAQPAQGVSPSLALLKEPGGSYRKRDWNPRLRSLMMQPKGLAEQIVNHKPEPYYSTHPTKSYMAALTRLAAKAGVALDAKVKGKTPNELIAAKRTARKIAAKLWIGDLLMYWKRALDTKEQVA